MYLTTLFISAGVFIAVCAIFWLLERIFDITTEDIADWFIGAVCVMVAVGMIYIIISPKDVSEHKIEYYYSDNQTAEPSECPILGDSCIVEEWGIECLFTKCIIDSRK